MVDSAIQSELWTLLNGLPLSKQREALDFVRALSASSNLPAGTPSHKLLKFLGRMSEEDARLMQEAMAECERIDVNEW